MAEREGFEPSVEFPLHTLSKRAPSTTRTSLRFGINGLRAVRNSVAQKSSFNLAVAKCAFYSAVYLRARKEHRENCDRPTRTSSRRGTPSTTDRTRLNMSAVISVRAAWCVASVGRTPPNPTYANDINEQNDRVDNAP